MKKKMPIGFEMFSKPNSLKWMGKKQKEIHNNFIARGGVNAYTFYIDAYDPNQGALVNFGGCETQVEEEQVDSWLKKKLDFIRSKNGKINAFGYVENYTKVCIFYCHRIYLRMRPPFSFMLAPHEYVESFECINL